MTTAAAAAVASEEEGLAVPGDRIGRVSSHQAGPGTYAMGSHIFASALGKIETIPSTPLPTLTVTNPTKSSSSSSTSSSSQTQDVVLEVGHTVLARILRITSKQATIEIISLIITTPPTHTHPHPQTSSLRLRQTCAGIIKKEDVRTHDIDRVEVHKCFRPGDIVKAKVVSLGDSRQYYLSTAEAELGVLYAKSQVGGVGGGVGGGGSVMVPVSHEMMMDPVTKVKESRKVAKPPSSGGGGGGGGGEDGMKV